MVIRGDSQARIAARLGVTQSTVSRDLREIRKDRSGRVAFKMWVDDRFAEEQIRFLRRELKDAWDSSHKPLVDVRPFDTPRRRRAKLRAAGQPAGDPRCLRWLLETGRLRQRILNRKEGVRYTCFSRIQISLERIGAAVESLRRLYPAEVAAGTGDRGPGTGLLGAPSETALLASQPSSSPLSPLDSLLSRAAGDGERRQGLRSRSRTRGIMQRRLGPSEVKRL